MKLKKHDFILIAICVVGVLVTFILLGEFKQNKSTDSKIENKVKELSDYSRFFTLESCMYKYIVYLQSKDTDSLLKLLNSDYIEKNSINQNNILDFLGYLEGMNTFKLKKVYYENLSNNVIKYYIYGQILEETIDDFSSVGNDKYFIMYMDINNMIYSVEPYEENLFNEVIYG